MLPGIIFDKNTQSKVHISLCLSKPMFHENMNMIGRFSTNQSKVTCKIICPMSSPTTSSDESDFRTIATQSNASKSDQEDYDGNLLTEDSGHQLFSLLKAIRENDPALYENLQFDKDQTIIDKDSLFNEYFTGVETAQEEIKVAKLKKKERKVEPVKPMKLQESSADAFLRQFVESKGWKLAGKDNTGINLGDEEDKQFEATEEQQNALDLEMQQQIEKRDLEEAAKKTAKPQVITKPKFHFEEEGGGQLAKIPMFTKKDGSVREKKVTRKEVERKARNEKIKRDMSTAEEKAELLRKDLSKVIVEDVIAFKELVKGKNPIYDDLTLSMDDVDESFFKIEDPTVYEELVFGSLDVYSDLKNVDVVLPLVKRIRKKFEEYYGTFVEDRQGDTEFRYKYKTVEKEDFGFTLDDIMDHTDFELNMVLPTASIRAKDECGVQLNKGVIRSNLDKMRRGKFANQSKAQAFDTSLAKNGEYFDGKAKEQVDATLLQYMHKLKRKRSEVEKDSKDSEKFKEIEK
jgi:hypothetical protein